MSENVLSQRQLNRALLARQHLLDRTARPLERVIEDVGGLQTQYAPAGYIGLWTRMIGFQRPMLTAALEERRVIQATLMRATIHMVSAADYWPIEIAVRGPRREWWLRVARSQMAGIDVDALSAAILEELGEGPARQKDLVERLRARGFLITYTSIYLLADVVRVPPSGTWDRRRADLYGLAEEWLPQPDPPPSETDASVHLVRRYLGGFGPAKVPEIGDFAGLPIATVRAAVGELAPRRFRDEAGRELVDLPDAPLPDPDTPAPPRFLPVWDATLLVHARRTQILPEEFRARVFNTKTPHSVNTFLLDGQVAGSWRYDRDRVSLEPFRTLTRTERSVLDDEAHRLEAFHAWRDE
ncbi:MAG TPA: winged helix DNA-binding domain-containing protein [Candidatus Limnocylindria bacterium]|nr:winged helix DNA-binding domain-containing protein [Candidatus Limnocylindria bacterium]